MVATNLEEYIRDFKIHKKVGTNIFEIPREREDMPEIEVACKPVAVVEEAEEKNGGISVGELVKGLRERGFTVIKHHFEDEWFEEQICVPTDEINIDK